MSRHTPAPRTAAIAATAATVAVAVAILASIAAAAAAAAPAAFASPAAAPTINTECGPVQGVPNGNGVDTYYGIPYGASPTGTRRFLPTESRKSAGACWTGTLNATAPADMCLQANLMQPTQPPTGVEDCLTLDVYRPTAAMMAASGFDTMAGVPVIVFIHGGDLTGGMSSTYNMSVVAHEGPVVVVNIQYRLGAFGFLATSDLSAVDPRGVSGNVGFMDQLLALQWVQRNIASFGGDPKRVLVSGQSSGGTSVFALLSSPASNGLFSAAVSLSGSPNMTIDLATAETQWSFVAGAVGCGPADGFATPNATVQCLQKVDGGKVIAAVANVTLLPNIFDVPNAAGGLGMPGLAIVDGVTVIKPLMDALSSAVNDVPLIVQTMAEEADIMPAHYVYNDTVTAFRAMLQKEMAPLGGDISDQLLAEFYVEALSDNPQRAFDQISADSGLTCGNAQVARAAAVGFRSPVYLGQVVSGITNPEPGLAPGTAIHYAFHAWDLIAGSELWSMFEEYGLPAVKPAPADIALGRVVRASWYGLAYNGTLEHSVPSWRAVNNVHGTEHYVAGVVSSEGVNMVPDNRKPVCDFFEQHGIDARFWWSN